MRVSHLELYALSVGGETQHKTRPPQNPDFAYVNNLRLVGKKYLFTCSYVVISHQAKSIYSKPLTPQFSPDVGNHVSTRICIAWFQLSPSSYGLKPGLPPMISLNSLVLSLP